MSSARITTNITLPVELHRDLRLRAAREGVSMAELVRRLLVQGLAAAEGVGRWATAGKTEEAGKEAEEERNLVREPSPEYKSGRLVAAVYEDGIFRPLEPASPQASQVYLLILSEEEVRLAVAQKEALQALEGLIRGEEGEVSGDPDGFLYGQEGKKGDA